MTSERYRREDAESDFFLPNTEILTSTATSRVMGFGSLAALLRARREGRLPISMFQIAGRQGWYARTSDVRAWLKATLPNLNPTPSRRPARRPRSNPSPLPPDKMVYVLKIVLQGKSPVVWRRLYVPCVCTFFDLHEVIQAALGWRQRKRHEFRIIRGQHAEQPIAIGDAESGDGHIPVLPEREVRLLTYFDCVSSLTYVYGFGQTWCVTVVRERTVRPYGGGYPKHRPGANTAPADA
jgi:hypothetical protein